MKTILLISPYWKESHRWMVSSYKLAELWQRIGFRVVAVCMGSETKVERQSDTLTVHYRKDIFLKDPWNYGICFGFSGYVRSLLRKENPDIIVVNKLLFWSSLATIPLRLMGRKVLVLTDAFVGMTWWPRGFLPKVFGAIYAWTLGWLILLSARRIVTFHPQPLRLLKRLGIAEKVDVIPTGIDMSLYHSSQGSDDVTVTYVGRLESVKGVDDFLASVAPLQTEYGHLTIQVVGWYKEGHPLVSQYERDVRFTGLRDDIPDLLSKTDIFVLPSYSEGLSNALMEAMSSGCACIATAVGGNTFLIQNGVSGFLYPPGDRAALTAHVKRLLDDHAKRRSLGEEARKRIASVFDWQVVSRQYKELFDTFQHRS